MYFVLEQSVGSLGINKRQTGNRATSFAYMNVRYVRMRIFQINLPNYSYACVLCNEQTKAEPHVECEMVCVIIRWLKNRYLKTQNT